jgi:signal transduction histidine kinase
MKRSFKIAPLLGSAVAVAVLVSNGVLSYYNTRRLANHDQAVAHTHAVITTLGEVLSTLKDAETGQRGFVITGEPRYLAPYESALKAIDRQFAALHELTANDPDEKVRIDSMNEKAARKLAELKHTVELRRTSFEAAQKVVLTDVGQSLMEEIRQLAADVERTEQRRLNEQEADAEQALFTAQVMNLVGSLTGIGAVAMAFLLLQRDRTEELTQANRVLQAEVEERKRAEARVRATADELQRSNRALQEFAGVASHDLQEPLRKIQAFGDRLKTKSGPALDDTGRDYLERMQGAAVRMSTLINDLLSYSRVSTKVQPFIPVDLGRVAKEVLSDLQARVQQTQGHVEVGPLPTVDADPLQMRQLLQNLISNALKFHRPGVPPLVQVTGERRECQGSQEPPICTITVLDNGIGFEEQFRDKIFGFFQRLHGRGEYEGTGMGLAICRRIVEQHGGTITATGKPGEGSSFVVTLPFSHPTRMTDHEQTATTNYDSNGRR